MAYRKGDCFIGAYTKRLYVSCVEIGGPKEVRALINDLQAILKTMEKSK